MVSTFVVFTRVHEYHGFLLLMLKIEKFHFL